MSSTKQFTKSYRRTNFFPLLLPRTLRSVLSSLGRIYGLAGKMGLWHSSCFLLLLVTYVTSYSSLARGSFPDGSFWFLLCHSKFSHILKGVENCMASLCYVGVQMKRFGYYLERWALNFSKAKLKSNIGSLQLVEYRRKEQSGIWQHPFSLTGLCRKA